MDEQGTGGEPRPDGAGVPRDRILPPRRVFKAERVWTQGHAGDWRDRFLSDLGPERRAWIERYGPKGSAGDNDREEPPSWRDLLDGDPEVYRRYRELSRVDWPGRFWATREHVRVEGYRSDRDPGAVEPVQPEVQLGDVAPLSFSWDGAGVRTTARGEEGADVWQADGDGPYRWIGWTDGDGWHPAQDGSRQPPPGGGGPPGPYSSRKVPGPALRPRCHGCGQEVPWGELDRAAARDGGAEDTWHGHCREAAERECLRAAADELRAAGGEAAQALGRVVRRRFRRVRAAGGRVALEHAVRVATERAAGTLTGWPLHAGWRVSRRIEHAWFWVSDRWYDWRGLPPAVTWRVSRGGDVPRRPGGGNEVGAHLSDGGPVG